jgi:hypothetical protein
MGISHSETLLVGKWLAIAGRVVADETCERIEGLVHSHLQELGRDETGWDALYSDPDDGRLWELTYPESHRHGGGPPQLRCLSPEEARKKYAGIVP